MGNRLLGDKAIRVKARVRKRDLRIGVEAPEAQCMVYGVKCMVYDVKCKGEENAACAAILASSLITHSS